MFAWISQCVKHNNFKKYYIYDMELTSKNINKYVYNVIWWEYGESWHPVFIGVMFSEELSVLE